MPTVTGADIPEDLLDLILSFLHASPISDRNVVGLGKHGLAHVSLVCRHWARLCQPKIFHILTLRTLDDARALASFVARPGSVVPRSVASLALRLVLDMASPPWVHLVCTQIVPHMTHPEFHLAFMPQAPRTGPLALGRNVHPALPSSLPLLSAGIQSVHLKNVRFKKLADLARLVGELPAVRDVFCERVTWPPGGVPPSFVNRRSREQFVVFHMDECTDACAAILLAAQVVPSKQPRLSGQECSAMYNIARVFLGSELQTAAFTFDITRRSGVIKLTGSNAYISFATIAHGSLMQVTGIVVQATYKTRIVKSLREYDWKTFSVHAASFDVGALRWLVLGFLSLDDAKAFALSVAKQSLPYFEGPDRIRYAVWNGELAYDAWRWVAVTVTPKTESQEEDVEDEQRRKVDLDKLHLLYD